MLFVLFHHLPIPITDGVIGYLHSNGGIGVDVFLILSGMGPYYSSSKGMNLKEYYIKRFIRIFPIYIVVVVLMSIGNFHGIGNLLLKMSTIGYWVNGIYYDWFIPFIVLMYILYSIRYRLKTY